MLLYLEEKRINEITTVAVQARSAMGAEAAKQALQEYLERTLRVDKDAQTRKVQDAMRELVLSQSRFKITPLTGTTNDRATTGHLPPQPVPPRRKG